MGKQIGPESVNIFKISMVGSLVGKKLFCHRSLVIILTVYFMLEGTYFDNFPNDSLSAHVCIIILLQYFDKRQVVFIRNIKQTSCKLIYSKLVLKSVLSGKNIPLP